MRLGHGRAVPLDGRHFLIGLGQMGHKSCERIRRRRQHFQAVFSAPSPKTIPIPGISFDRIGRPAQSGLGVARGVFGQLCQRRHRVTWHREFGRLFHSTYNKRGKTRLLEGKLKMIYKVRQEKVIEPYCLRNTLKDEPSSLITHLAFEVSQG